MILRHRAVAALFVSLSLLAAVGCSSSSTAEVDRGASSSDCRARFGCAKTPATFRVVNDSDTTVTLEASEFVDVREADRLALTITVPAHFTTPVQAVYLGDDGLESSEGIIPGGYVGYWTWTMRTDTSTTVARVMLRLNEDFETGMGLFLSWAQIGQPGISLLSMYEPVTLKSTTGVASWKAKGSHWDWGGSVGGDATAIWTFSAP